MARLVEDVVADFKDAGELAGGGAGVGEEVLTVSGSTARKIVGSDTVPVDAAIVAIIDTLEVEREKAAGRNE